MSQTASGQESLKLPELLLLSGHPKRQATWGGEETRGGGFMLAARLSWRPLPRTPFPVYFLWGTGLQERFLCEIWVGVELATPYPPWWAAGASLSTVPLLPDPPLTSLTLGPGVCLAQQGRVFYWLSMVRGKKNRWISAPMLTCEFQLVFAVPHFTSIFPSA